MPRNQISDTDHWAVRLRMEQPGCIGYPQSMASQPFRPACPKCGIHMIVAAGFNREPEVQTLECLRCGFVKQPVPASAANANQQ